MATMKCLAGQGKQLSRTMPHGVRAALRNACTSSHSPPDECRRDVIRCARNLRVYKHLDPDLDLDLDLDTGSLDTGDAWTSGLLGMDSGCKGLLAYEL
jgi:hypothetical protein